MKKISWILLLTLCTAFGRLGAQTVYPEATDGKIYVKIWDFESKTLPSYSGGSTSGFPEEIIGLIQLHSITAISSAFPLVSDPTINKIYQVDFSNLTDVDMLIRRFEKLGYIEYAEMVPYNTTSITCPTTEDAIYPNYWSTPAQSYHLNLVNACNAYTAVSSNTLTVNVAIIDNEFNTAHTDLTNRVFQAWDVADGDAIVSGPNSTFDHGTHVAGIAGAETDNNVGIASLGANLIDLTLVKATRDIDPGNSITFGYQGITWAVNNGANVVSCSWGGTLFSSAEQTLINWAYAQGCIIVAAAGNDNNNTLHYPAAYNNVFAVGNTDGSDIKSASSCYGTWVDICAPGENILSTVYTGGYGTKTGTSMSTPMVSALCGLIWSTNSAYNQQQVLNCITGTAVNINSLNPVYAGQLGAGRIDAQAALNCAQTASDYVDFSASANSVCAGSSISFTDNSVTTNTITAWSWSFPGGTPSSSTTQNPSITYNTSGVYDVTLTVTTSSGTFSQTFLNYITVIGVTSFSASAAGDPCEGSEQQLNLLVNGQPPYTVTYDVNGGPLQFTTFNANNVPLYVTLFGPTASVNITNIQSGSTSCPVSQSYTCNVIKCCPSVVTNGDFSSGNTGFSCTNALNATQCPGRFNVGAYSGPLATWTGWNLFSTIADRGQSLYIDGRANPACAMGDPVTPFPAGAWGATLSGVDFALWEQTVNLEAGTDYSLRFFTTEGNMLPVVPMQLRVRIWDGSGNAHVSTYTVTHTPMGTWQQQGITIIDPAALSGTGTYTITIEQHENFAFVEFDFLIDDVELQPIFNVSSDPCCIPPTVTFTGSSTTSTAAGMLAPGSVVVIPVNHNFIIDDSPTYTNVTFRLQSNAKITVKSLTTSSATNTLTFNNCELYTDCGYEMWDGIYLEHIGNNYGNINMHNGTSMEDAKNGIVATGNTATGNNTNISAAITIRDCILNKNHYNIQISNYTNTSTPYNLSINTSTLSCVSSFNSPGNTLNIPYAGQRSYTGVRLSNVTNCPIGLTTAAGDMNYFSDMDYGVYATTSGVQVVNNHFSSMAGNVVSSVPTGVGVYAPNTSTNSRVLSVGGSATYAPNVFSDLFRAVDATFCGEVEVLNNQMSCTSTPTTFTVSGNITSQFGVRVFNTATKVDIEGNTITNFANAIGMRRNVSTSTSFNPNTIIQTNTITVSGSGYVSNGIVVADANGNSISASGPVHIRDNSLSNIRDYGVQCQYILNHPVVAGTSAGAQSIGMLYGSSSTVSNGVYMLSCRESNISNNEIYSSNNSATGMVGVYLNKSRNSLVSCNDIHDIGIAFRAEGNSQSAYASATSYQYGVVSNTFTNTSGGISLVLSGDIGNQGDATHPAGNVWASSSGSYTSGQLLTDGMSTTNIYYYDSGQPTQDPSANRVNWGASGIATATGSIPLCPGSSSRMALGTKGETSAVSLFPNPNNGYFTIISKNTIGFARIEVYNLLGKKVQEFEMKEFNALPVNLSEASSGIYYIHVSGNGINETLKVIKE